MVEINNKYIKSINYLINKKTQNLFDKEKSLFQHLINVYNILRKWNCCEDVCFAGIFYCVYENKISEKNRETIKDIIGEKAEKIIFDFNKNKFLSDETKIIFFAINLESSLIKIFDNIYDQKNIDDFYFYFRDEAPWYFVGSGSDNNMWRKFTNKLTFKHSLEKKLNKLSLDILKSYGIDKFLKLERAYASANVYGTVHESHQDSLNLGDVTVMFYLNKHWSLDYAGETVFYCLNKQNIISSVIPKPARALLFDANIPHCARDVRRDVNDLRMVLTFKYSLNIKKTKIYSPW